MILLLGETSRVRSLYLYVVTTEGFVLVTDMIVFVSKLVDCVGCFDAEAGWSDSGVCPRSHC